MGSFEFARFVFVRNSIDQAAYEACRFGIIPGHSASEVREHAVRFLTKAGIIEASVNVLPAVIDSATREITVDIQVNFSRNSWIPPTFARNSTLRSTIALEHENVATLLANQ